ncbi:MAG: hypothetical protein P8Q36_09035 [Alphaproteobacteria bacterium]|jgi:uncharacterized protein|nr:hypothetical protein [Rhodospirillaceae bacterium]MDG2480994.1 hypothetical protein [Alphaproteobacteria bacterium]MBT6202448.1 hypothetical protein [Rhodospirillaceae bacterium]MBT6512883.1 hypothetical protein [Rhodospirillaceae bacterium]MBT7611935.1 hypothetical protein [Rhodospirillaceae bacterium]
MKSALGLICLCGALLAVSTGAQAQSSDCQKAATPTEHAICDSRSLSNLDMKMGTLYGVAQEVPMLMGESGNQQDLAHEFITRRNACGGDVSCLKDVYEARNKVLETFINNAMSDYCKAIDIC